MRTRARTVIFNLIYMSFFEEGSEISEGEIFDQKIKEAFDYLSENEGLDEKGKEFALEIYSAYVSNKTQLSQLVEKSLVGYEPSRVYKTDLSLIYLAAAEILFVKTPKPVVIDEVLKIAKQFSTEKSASFINGVLAKIIE